MGIVIAIVIIALILGVLGVIVEGLLWLLFIAAAVLLVAFLIGVVRGRSSRVP